MKFLERPAVRITLITLLCLLAYSNTFHAPFQYDDRSFVTDNPAVNGSVFKVPSRAEDLKMDSADFRVLKARAVVFASFWLNKKIGGMNVRGYHVFNIAVHLMNALLVYYLVILTSRTPFLIDAAKRQSYGTTISSMSSKKGIIRGSAGYVALITALLFVSHPVQTQAVTYITQRFTSLAAFFYLFSLIFYIKWRLFPLISLSQGKVAKGKAAFYFLSLLCAVLAMKSKENAFTLPLAIALYEFMFFEGPFGRRLLYLAPIGLTMIIVPLAEVTGAGGVGEATRTITRLPRHEYLFTQFGVIVTYIRLLFFPANQNLDYDYPVFHSFSEPNVFLSFLFLAVVFCSGICLFLRSRHTAGLRIISFGIFWFFLTLSVESSIIPIIDIIAEHRLYLPSVGVFSAIATGAVLALKRLHGSGAKFAAYAAVAVIPFVLSYATFERNKVWRSEISLWEDVVRKSPGKARGHNNLGNACMDKGFFDKAIEHHTIALRLNQGSAEGHYNLGIAYKAKGLSDKAIEHFQIALSLKPDYAAAHNNLGVVYKTEGLLDRAMEHLRIALRLKPDYAEAHNNLGNTYRTMGLYDTAIEHLQIAIRLKPDYADAYTNMGIAYSSEGMFDEAIKCFRIALGLCPDSADLHFNIGLAYFEKGSMDEAHREFETALQINPDHRKARQYLNRIK